MKQLLLLRMLLILGHPSCCLWGLEMTHLPGTHLALAHLVNGVKTGAVVGQCGTGCNKTLAAIGHTLSLLFITQLAATFNRTKRLRTSSVTYCC